MLDRPFHRAIHLMPLSRKPGPPQAAQKWIPLRDSLSGETGEFYFGTFGENSSGIDNANGVMKRDEAAIATMQIYTPCSRKPVRAAAYL
jgi:hypothetical protein